MCQLLGINCNVPTDFEGKGCRSFMDIMPAYRSPVAHLVKAYPIKSLNIITHIRKATVSKVYLENTYPFVRELGGASGSSPITAI